MAMPLYGGMQKHGHVVGRLIQFVNLFCVCLCFYMPSNKRGHDGVHIPSLKQGTKPTFVLDDGDQRFKTLVSMNANWSRTEAKTNNHKPRDSPCSIFLHQAARRWKQVLPSICCGLIGVLPWNSDQTWIADESTNGVEKLGCLHAVRFVATKRFTEKHVLLTNQLFWL